MLSRNRAIDVKRLLDILFALSLCVPVASEEVLGVALLCVDADSIAREIAMSEVTITARARAVSVIPAQRLSGAELSVLSSHSVADALRYFSGVQIKDYGGVGGLKTVDVRSMGTHHLGVFYDGIEVGNAQNGTVDLGKFSMDNIEEVSLYNGQKSEIFQSARDYGSAGTLYIRTRRPHFGTGEKYHLLVSMKAGTFGLANPSVLYEQKLTDGISLSVSGEYMYATGRYHFRYHKMNPNHTVAWDTVGIRQNGDVQAWRGEVGLFGYLPDGKWHIKGYYYDSEKGIPRAIIRNVWTCAQRQWDRNAFVQGQIEKTLLRGWDTQFSAKYSNDYMRYLNPDTTMMYVDNQFWQQEVYLSWVNRYSIFSWWDVALSADYQWNWLDATLPEFAMPERHTVLLAPATAFHYKWFRAQLSVLGTFVRDAVHRSGSRVAKPVCRWTPAVSVSYQPLLGEQLFVRTFYKQVFRMPTFNDLYYTDIGNSALDPEFTSQYDVGVEYTKTLKASDFAVQLHGKADGYFNQVKNKIIAIPKGNSQYRWTMMNIGYVEIGGIDVNVGTTWRLPYDVELAFRLSYTYQQARDMTDPSDTLTYKGQISYIPWHSGSVIGSLSWRGWGLNYSFIYVGERYHNSANIPANYEQPWYTHDLSVSKLWDFRSWRFSTTVEVNNLLNQQYDVIHNYPMPGINGKVILKFII